MRMRLLVQKGFARSFGWGSVRCKEGLPEAPLHVPRAVARVLNPRFRVFQFYTNIIARRSGPSGPNGRKAIILRLPTWDLQIQRRHIKELCLLEGGIRPSGRGGNLGFRV